MKFKRRIGLYEKLFQQLYIILYKIHVKTITSKKGISTSHEQMEEQKP